MAETSSSSIWDSLGAGAIAAGLSYAQSRGIDVPPNGGTMTNPDIASQYYGYGQSAAQQPTVGYGTAASSSGSSTLLIVVGVIVLGLAAVLMLRKR